MAQIAVAPFVLRDMILSIGTDSYELHVNEVEFTPSSQTQTWQGGTPAASFTEQTNPTWTCKITGAQDWTTVNSLAQYLLANQGQSKAAVFKPQGAATGKPSFASTIVIAPPPVGGKVNTFLELTVTMGCTPPVKTANP